MFGGNNSNSQFSFGSKPASTTPSFTFGTVTATTAHSTPNFGASTQTITSASTSIVSSTTGLSGLFGGNKPSGGFSFKPQTESTTQATSSITFGNANQATQQTSGGFSSVFSSGNTQQGGGLFSMRTNTPAATFGMQNIPATTTQNFTFGNALPTTAQSSASFTFSTTTTSPQQIPSLFGSSSNALFSNAAQSFAQVPSTTVSVTTQQGVPSLFGSPSVMTTQGSSLFNTAARTTSSLFGSFGNSTVSSTTPSGNQFSSGTSTTQASLSFGSGAATNIQAAAPKPTSFQSLLSETKPTVTTVVTTTSSVISSPSTFGIFSGSPATSKPTEMKTTITQGMVPGFTSQSFTAAPVTTVMSTKAAVPATSLSLFQTAANVPVTTVAQSSTFVSSTSTSFPQNFTLGATSHVTQPSFSSLLQPAATNTRPTLMFGASSLAPAITSQLTTTVPPTTQLAFGATSQLTTAVPPTTQMAFGATSQLTTTVPPTTQMAFGATPAVTSMQHIFGLSSSLVSTTTTSLPTSALGSILSLPISVQPSTQAQFPLTSSAPTSIPFGMPSITATMPATFTALIPTSAPTLPSFGLPSTLQSVSALGTPAFCTSFTGTSQASPQISLTSMLPAALPTTKTGFGTRSLVTTVGSITAPVLPLQSVTTTTSGVSVTSVQPTSASAEKSIQFGQLEQVINRFVHEVEAQEHTFMNQVLQLNAYDRVLRENEDKILELSEEVQVMEKEKDRFKSSIDFLSQQQAELEAVVSEMESSLCLGDWSELKQIDLPDPSMATQADVQRQTLLQLQLNVDAQLKQISDEMREINEQVIDLQKPSRVGNDEEPERFEIIAQILKQQVEILDWIDQQAETIKMRAEKLSEEIM